MNQLKPPQPTETLVHARDLRTSQTDAEQKIWSRLRGRQVRDLKFRRQHPIPPYIADFCCVERKLVIELDGSQHQESVDETRTLFLEQQGWKVLRYWDNDGLSQTDVVLDSIWDATAQPDPHPNLSPGAGEAIEPRR